MTPPPHHHAAAARRAALASAAALVALLSASGCSTSAGSSTGSKGYVAGDGAIVTIAGADRRELPDVSGPALGGGTVSLSDHAGKVIVINVWAAWCGPCRAEADDLVEAAGKATNAAFVGINTRDNPAQAAAFVRSHAIPYPSLLDENGKSLLEFYGLINPKALPTTLVVDEQGRIAALVNGPVTAITLLDLVDEVADET